MTDTPDIVERLRLDAIFNAPSTKRLIYEAAAEITRLRAQPLAAYPDYLAAGAQPAPLTRDEGGAVEEWVMVPREPTEAMNAAGYGNGRNARPIYRAMIAAAPKPGDRAVHLAHCYQGDYDGSCKYGDDDCPAKPGEAMELRAAELVAETEALRGRLQRSLRAGPPHPDHPADLIRASDSLIDRLAAALTPRELTDEEAERGARAIRSFSAKPMANPSGNLILSTADIEAMNQAHAMELARAAYRAIAAGDGG